MSRTKQLLPWLLVFGCASFACQPSDPCDPGQYADHGACYPIHDAAADDEDAGGDAGTEDRYAGFGKSCTQSSDCPETAPSCGAPMLPLCTVVNCLAMGAGACPPDWTCMDVKDLSPDPSVESVCVNF